MTLWQGTQTSVVPSHWLLLGRRATPATGKLQRELCTNPGFSLSLGRFSLRTSFIFSLRAITGQWSSAWTSCKEELEQKWTVGRRKVCSCHYCGTWGIRLEKTCLSLSLCHLLIGQFRSQIMCSTTVYRWSKINWKERKWGFWPHLCVFQGIYCFRVFCFLNGLGLRNQSNRKQIWVHCQQKDWWFSNWWIARRRDLWVTGEVNQLKDLIQW